MTLALATGTLTDVIGVLVHLGSSACYACDREVPMQTSLGQPAGEEGPQGSCGSLADSLAITEPGGEGILRHPAPG